MKGEGGGLFESLLVDLLVKGYFSSSFVKTYIKWQLPAFFYEV